MNEIRSLTDDELVLLEALREARAEAKSWGEQSDRIRKALLDSIDESVKHLGVGEMVQLYSNGDVVAEVVKRESTRFNKKLCAKDWPKIMNSDDYNTKTPSTVVNIIGGETNQEEE